jgi:ATP/maltotriose-dependent transcriptional regulator MalT
LADGAASSAVALLEQARGLVSSRTDAQAFADVLENLLLALLETGQIDRALAFADTLDVTSGGLLQPRRLAALHTQLAWVAALDGRLAVGTAQVAAARALVGADATDRDTAPIDAVAAFLEAERPRAGALELAEELARTAAAAAQRVPLPSVACQAWHLLGILTRRRGIDEADAYFQRIEATAAEHQLEIWRLRAHALLAGNDALRQGSVDRLARVRNEAMRMGALAIGYGLEATLAFQSVLRGEYDNAADFLDSCWAPAVRLRLSDIVRYLAMTRAALAAHRCRRPAMEQALAEFRQWGGGESPYLSLTWGLCEAVCALLEEDADSAASLLARAEEDAKLNPSFYLLAGRNGLTVLLNALRGQLDLAQSSAACEAPASHLRWNRQFVLLAHATVLGRGGRAAAAAEAARQAIQDADAFAMARHLGLRLVAEAALADGWGDPVSWLRTAEEYFHAAHIPATASACRALLRRAGASVGQHRGGQERIPVELRRLGVTTREFDVLELLADRRGNKEIASRLHLSPRTVEKHVASLIVKTGQADRAALSAYGAVTIRTTTAD